MRIVSEQQAAQDDGTGHEPRQGDLNCIEAGRAVMLTKNWFKSKEKNQGSSGGAGEVGVELHTRDLAARLPLPVQSCLKDGQLEFSHEAGALNLKISSVQEQIKKGGGGRVVGRKAGTLRI